MVAHDSENQKIVPIFEFSTTDQTSDNISIFLQKGRSLLFRYLGLKNLIIPPVTVVDFSWAMINSVMKTFNKDSSVYDFLVETFECLINKKEFDFKRFSTIVYICAGHFLKAIINNAKKVVDIHSDKMQLKLFIFSFTLIQNSVSIQQVNLFIFHVQNIFLTEFRNPSVDRSIQIIGDELKKRNVSSVSISSDDYIESSTSETDEKPTFYNTEKVISNESPFRKYYERIIDENFQKLRWTESEIMSCERNSFFNKRLFNIIKERLYLLPMWSGLMLNVCHEKFPSYFPVPMTRLTNNPVENYFGFLKNNLLQRSNELMLSELSSKLWVRLKAIYLETYFTNKPFYLHLEQTQLDNQRQIWMRKKHKQNNQTFYYKPTARFGCIDNDDRNEETDFEKEFCNSTSITAKIDRKFNSIKNTYTTYTYCTDQQIYT